MIRRQMAIFRPLGQIAIRSIGKHLHERANAIRGNDETQQRWMGVVEEEKKRRCTQTIPILLARNVKDRRTLV